MKSLCIVWTVATSSFQLEHMLQVVCPACYELQTMKYIYGENRSMGNTMGVYIQYTTGKMLQDRGMNLSEQHIVLVYDIVNKP